MFEDLKNEMHSFFNDMDENIENKEDLKYIKKRTLMLFDAIFDNIEKIATYKDAQMKSIIKKQEIGEQKMHELKEKVEEMYEELYDESEVDFSINCPYCNYEFDADIDDDIKEIKCPECGNTIELDWNGNPDDDGENCSGGCSGCGGCK